MLKDSYDLIIAGGGPAGLSAAIGASEAGLKDILIVERMKELGGVLYQCIHMGFGLLKFGEEMTGPEYADRIISLVKELDIDILTDATVLKIEKDKRVIIASAQEGIKICKTRAVIIATGCRERPAGTLPIAGTRPSGIFTAGAAQRLINLKGLSVGNKIIILGSGDIGMIMARRLTLLGKEVSCVIEQYPYCTGLLRNKVQCLDDFNIKLLTSHTVTEIFGNERIEGVAVCPVDENLEPDFSRKFRMDCDTLITSVGLIPETELLDEIGQQPWIFTCGNAAYVHDLVDHVSEEGEMTGKYAAQYVKGCKRSGAFTNSDFACPDIGLANGLANGAEYNGAAYNEAVYNEVVYNKPVPRRKLSRNEIACTICPRSCVLSVNGDEISGAGCERGEEYARTELASPKRYVTATVAVKGVPEKRIPVRSAAPVPKDKIPEIMNEIRSISVGPDVVSGQVIHRNAGGTGVDLIATTGPMKKQGIDEETRYR